MATEAVDRSVLTRWVRYGNDVEAFLAAPAGPGPHRTVILLHEKFGLFQHTLDLAQKFAGDGYLCLAPNLFSRHPEQDRIASGEIRVPLPDPQVTEDLGASIAYLRASEASALAERVAVMGVCQTGRYPLVLAAERDDVSACLVFYGAAQPREWQVDEVYPEGLDAALTRVRCPVLGVFGELDFLISVPNVLRFRDALEAGRVSYHVRIFAGANHAFLNDTEIGGHYHPQQAAAAWQLVLDFLRRVESGAYPADRVQWRFESDAALAVESTTT